VAGAGAG
jgi:hypothetical protein